MLSVPFASESQAARHGGSGPLSSGFADRNLNPNLLGVTYPEEVANGGLEAIIWVYDDSDRVIELSVGGGRVNQSGVPAGGTYTIRYESLNEAVPPGNLDLPRGKATITEPNGNVFEYFVNELQHHIIARRLTRGFREGEPEFYETNSFFDADGQLIRRVYPEGNEERYTYDSSGSLAA